jgi:hypothetical protein
MSISIAAQEAFDLLNAGTRLHYRGRGDTATAARDRAAKEAGITIAQGERVWKRWEAMKTVNGDVYRALRNKYGHLCSYIENKADAIEREAQQIEETNAAQRGHQAAVARHTAPQQGEEREMR